MPAKDFPLPVVGPASDAISSALESTVSRNAATVERIALQHGLSGPDVDEVMQDVRIRLWRALVSDDRIAGVSASYLYRTAASAARDLLRRRRVQRTRENLGARLQSPPYDPPAASIERAEIAERIARAMSLLADARRRVVRLHLAGYHRDEIAQRFGWSEARTRHLLYRGLADLREKLTGEAGDR